MHDVTPELALVDDALADRERARLPEPGDCLAPRPAPVETAVAPARPAPILTLVAAPEAEVVEVEPEPVAAPASVDDPLVEDPPALAPAPAPTYVEAPQPLAELVTEKSAETPPPAEPTAPVRMPEWVASDVPPKRRRRRKDRDPDEAQRRRPVRRRVAVAASWVVLCGFLASPLLAFIPSPTGERPTLEQPPGGVETVDAGDAAGHTLRWEPVPKAAGYSVVFVDDGDRSDRWSQNAQLVLPAGTEAEQLVTYEWFVYPAFRDGAGYRYGPLVASGEVTMPRLGPTES